MSYIASVFRVTDLTRSQACDQAALEHAEHLDACAVISAAAKLADEFPAAGAPLSVPLRTTSYGVEFYVRDPGR